MENGIPNGDIKMAPVPSVVDLCTTTLKLYGTKTFEDIVAPTLALLDAGEADWHPELATHLASDGCVGTEDIWEPRGKRSKRQAIGFTDGTVLTPTLPMPWKVFTLTRAGFSVKADLAAHVTLVEDPATVDVPRIYGV